MASAIVLGQPKSDIVILSTAKNLVWLEDGPFPDSSVASLLQNDIAGNPC